MSAERNCPEKRWASKRKSYEKRDTWGPPNRGGFKRGGFPIFSRKKWETPPVWQPPGVASLKTRNAPSGSLKKRSFAAVQEHLSGSFLNLSHGHFLGSSKRHLPKGHPWILLEFHLNLLSFSRIIYLRPQVPAAGGLNLEIAESG